MEKILFTFFGFIPLIMFMVIKLADYYNNYRKITMLTHFKISEATPRLRITKDDLLLVEGDEKNFYEYTSQGWTKFDVEILAFAPLETFRKNWVKVPAPRKKDKFYVGEKVETAWGEGTIEQILTHPSFENQIKVKCAKGSPEFAEHNVRKIETQNIFTKQELKKLSRTNHISHVPNKTLKDYTKETNYFNKHVPEPLNKKIQTLAVEAGKQNLFIKQHLEKLSKPEITYGGEADGWFYKDGERLYDTRDSEYWTKKGELVHNAVYTQSRLPWYKEWKLDGCPIVEPLIPGENSPITTEYLIRYKDYPTFNIAEFERRYQLIEYNLERKAQILKKARGIIFRQSYAPLASTTFLCWKCGEHTEQGRMCILCIANEKYLHDKKNARNHPNVVYANR